MLIILFVFVGSTFYGIKYGVGREKLLFLYPLGIYLTLSIAHGIIKFLFPTMPTAVDLTLGLGVTVAVVSTCIWIVAKVRKNSMTRVMEMVRVGSHVEEPRKLEL